MEKSKNIRANIEFLNTEVFGESAKSAQDNPEIGEDDTGDEMENLLARLALDEEQDAAPTVDLPSPPSAAPLLRVNPPLDPLSRNPSRNPSDSVAADVAVSSSARGAAETADVPLAKPSAPQKTGKKKKATTVAVSEGTLNVRKTRETRRNKSAA